MGYEFRIKTVPIVENLEEVVAPSLDTTERIIESSLHGLAIQKLGIASDATYGTNWPHCCDLKIEESGTIYALGHGKIGCEQIYRLIEQLKVMGYIVEVDDDI